MKNDSMNWRNLLYELNEFGCKIEFLQSKMRNQVVVGKIADVDKYIESVKKLVVEHEHNLYLDFCDMKIDMIRKNTAMNGQTYPKLVIEKELIVD